MAVPFIALFGRLSDGSFYEGTGQKNLMGTVTITATAYGQFNASVLLYPNVTGVYNAVSRTGEGIEIDEIESTVMPMTFLSSGFSVTPVPEPSTALLLGLGLAGIGVSTRRSRYRDKT